MQFLADESCDFAVVRALREAGYDVKTVRELSAGADDEVVMDLAAKEKHLLLTEDKDFGRLVFAASGFSTGVIFLRFPGNARASMTKAIVELVQRMGEKLKGRFVVVQPGRVRISGPLAAKK